MAINSRSKGRRGQLEFGNLLRDRDWELRELNSGTAVEDFLAIDPGGVVWSVEVKNAIGMNIRKWRKQAIRQAGRMPWMLACKIDGTSSWLILRKSDRPTIWHAKEGDA